MLWCSQVAPGNENALRLRVYGEKGGLEWAQEDPNYLWYTPLGEPKRLLTRGGAGAGPAAARVSRTPGGHPEGYLEGFANIYAEAARAIRARRERPAGAAGRGLSDDRGRRRRASPSSRPACARRRGTAPGSRSDRAAPRARGWRAGRSAAAPGSRRRRRRPARRVGQERDQPLGQRDADRVEVGVEMRQRRAPASRVSSVGKVQTTETSLADPEPQLGEIARRGAAAMLSCAARMAVGARPARRRAARPAVGQPAVAASAAPGPRRGSAPSRAASARNASRAAMRLVVQRRRSLQRQREPAVAVARRRRAPPRPPSPRSRSRRRDSRRARRCGRRRRSRRPPPCR